jgi:outer membrane beta-barrel protein
MKKLFIFVFLVMMTFASLAHAEVNAGSFSFTPFAGGYFFEGNQNFKDRPVVGLRAGYSFTDHLALEGFFHYLQTESDVPGDNAWYNRYMGGLEGLYHFMPQSRFVPFLAVGVGGVHIGNTGDVPNVNRLVLDYGAGMKIFITDNIALRADVRHVLPMNERYNDLLVTFGITFSFGGGKSKKEVARIKAEEPDVVEKPAPAPIEPIAKTEPAAPVPEPETSAAPAEPAPVEKAQEPSPPAEPVAAAPSEKPVVTSEPAVPLIAPAAAAIAAPEKSKPVAQDATEETIRAFVEKWRASWETGDMDTYRSCYTPDFKTKGMNLDGWIDYKVSVRQKSKDISIRLENLKISADKKSATARAVFTQYYSSSIFKDVVKKTLSLKEINDEWKIYRETINP